MSFLSACRLCEEPLPITPAASLAFVHLNPCILQGQESSFRFPFSPWGFLSLCWLCSPSCPACSCLCWISLTPEIQAVLSQIMCAHTLHMLGPSDLCKPSSSIPPWLCCGFQILLSRLIKAQQGSAEPELSVTNSEYKPNSQTPTFIAIVYPYVYQKSVFGNYSNLFSFSGDSGSHQK